MGIRTFLIKQSSGGTRLEQEKTEARRQLKVARAEVKKLREEIRTAEKNRGQPPPRNVEIEAGLTQALQELIARETTELYPGFKSAADRLNLAASEVDVMMVKSTPLHYLEVGISAMQAMHIGISDLAARPPKRILDFGCGYGRVGRFMQATWPEAALRVCDVDFAGLGFCIAHLGMQGFRVGTDPTAMSLGGGYDLIWVGSVVTHLDGPVIKNLLSALGEALAPGGHVVFTTHGDFAMGVLQSQYFDYDLQADDARKLPEIYSSTGFAYADYPNVKGYGVSGTSVAWLQNTVAEIPSLEWTDHRPQGWDGHQDVVVCRRVS